MQINNVNMINFNGIGVSRILNHTTPKVQPKYIQDACYKFSTIMGQSSSKILDMTKDADAKKFSFLRTMVNKYNQKKFCNVEENSDCILNIYSMVEKPSEQHFNIIRHSKDSFEQLEKIFSLAKDEKSLDFVEKLQYDILKDTKNNSNIIIDLLSSKNKEKFIKKPENYSSYIKLHAGEKNAIAKLDELIESGRYSRLRSDAQWAIKKLMRNKIIQSAMSGKTNDLERMYTKDRESFLTTLIKNYIPGRKTPKEETKTVVVDMYGSLNTGNSKLRSAIIDRFKNAPVQNRAAEIVQMQTLFDNIDHNKDAKEFVRKAIDKDLRIGSIAELNEILKTVPLKKANIFFDNAKRIIEHSSGEERKSALIVELENPFFTAKKTITGKARMVRMFENRQNNENLFVKAVKIINNKINQYKYYRLAA